MSNTMMQVRNRIGPLTVRFVCRHTIPKYVVIETASPLEGGPSERASFELSLAETAALAAMLSTMIHEAQEARKR